MNQKISVVNLHQKAQLYLAQGKLEEAIAVCKQALEIEPNFPPTYKTLGNILQRMGEIDQAKEWYIKALNLQPNWAEVYANLGSIYAQQQQWELAIESYKKAISIKPNVAGLYRNLGKIWQGVGKIELARDCQEKADNLEQKYSLALEHFKQGKKLWEVGEIEAAIAYFQSAIELNPYLAEAYQKLGDALVEKMQLNQAIEFYEKARELEPKLWVVYQKIGKFWQQIGELDAAINNFRLAIEINPKFPWSYKNLGDIFFQKGELDAAKENYQNLIKLQPDIWDAHRKLSEILLQQKKLDDAIEKCQYIIKIKPHSPWWAYQILGDAYIQKKEWNKAVIVYQKAITKKADLPECYNQLGDALMQLSKWSEAVTAFRRFLEIKPDSYWCYNKLGKALEKQNLLAEARACYEKAIQLQPPRKSPKIIISVNQKIKVNFVDFWRTFNHKNLFLFGKFLTKNYNICISEEPDFLFYSVFGEEHHQYNCKKIFYTAENYHNYLFGKGDFQRHGMQQVNFRECDFALTHYYIDDPRHYRIPLYFLRTGLQEIKQLTKQKNPQQIIKRKQKFCCFVYSNKSAHKRINFFHQLCRYKQVDSGGKVLNNLGFLAPQGKKYIEFLSEYKFVIAFENSSTPGYTTEKIFQAMQAQTVPIYWGNIWIDQEFNPNSFVNYHNFSSEEEVISRIIELDTDDELYQQVLEEPYLPDNQVPEFLKVKHIKGFFDKIFYSI
ncbi:MAG: tetratricopeptide repeat protein [Microcoleaceae cyanobacterium MO_207.B10]|nr:tetratricopeptide repeat protein [Microcoleaceae cyanobacterium MO_207.B10]